MVEKMKVTVLVDDLKNPRRSDLQAKHGLSIYLEMRDRREQVNVLVDTGPSPELVLHNADAMNVNLDTINVILLSHGHYDHVGGLIGVLKRIRDSIVVVAHPETFNSKFAYRPYLKYLGSAFHLQEIEASGGVLLRAKNPIKIADGILSSGEVERGTAFEKVDGFWKVDDEMLTEDIMLDDQSLIVNITGRGLVIIAGCAHSGIINTIRQAQRITGVSKIHAVIGGFHLKNAGDKRIDATTNELLRLKPDIIGPCHCTGSKAVKRFTDAFKDRCKPLRVGDILELMGGS